MFKGPEGQDGRYPRVRHRICENCPFDECWKDKYYYGLCVKPVLFGIMNGSPGLIIRDTFRSLSRDEDRSAQLSSSAFTAEI